MLPRDDAQTSVTPRRVAKRSLDRLSDGRTWRSPGALRPRRSWTCRVYSGTVQGRCLSRIPVHALTGSYSATRSFPPRTRAKIAGGFSSRADFKWPRCTVTEDRSTASGNSQPSAATAASQKRPRGWERPRVFAPGFSTIPIGGLSCFLYGRRLSPFFTTEAQLARTMNWVWTRSSSFVKY